MVYIKVIVALLLTKNFVVHFEDTCEAKPINRLENEMISFNSGNNESFQIFLPNAPYEELEDPIESSGQFEGDILIKPQKEMNAVRSEYLKWPEGKVPYALPTFFGIQGRIAVALAASEFSRRTCVKFVPRTNESDYISIIRGGGCYSMIGRIGGKQELSLAGPCHRTGIVAHELMHALGFWHEQSRSDRDEYVTVRWENIAHGTENNFQKYSTYVQQTLDEDYDYGSLMHYSQNAFSKNARPTIIPKNIFAGIIMGQRFGLSPTDLRKINKLYNCTEFL